MAMRLSLAFSMLFFAELPFSLNSPAIYHFLNPIIGLVFVNTIEHQLIRKVKLT
jgi:hypothetical protein